jgi:hypothetical protein
MGGRFCFNHSLTQIGADYFWEWAGRFSTRRFLLSEMMGVGGDAFIDLSTVVARSI